ncbi:MAG: PorT family protein [Gammaproteobacteria bacterium]|nr:MAG: PorT family protein [Gammaproteobacteria bacterium]
MMMNRVFNDFTKLKGILLLIAFTTFAFALQAQKLHVRGGVNLANVSVTDNGRVNESNQLTSFQLGLMTDIPLIKSVLSLQPGVIYSGKGAKVQNGTEGQNAYFRQSFNPRYIEVPLNLKVMLPFAKESGLFLGAGPYGAVGIGGKVKTEGRLIGAEYNFERNITFSDDDPTTFDEEEGTGLGIVRRFDYGVNAMAGFEIKQVVVTVNYGIGLTKLQSGTTSSEDNNNKHRLLSFTLGFKL